MITDSFGGGDVLSNVKAPAVEVLCEHSVVRECVDKIVRSPAFRASSRPKQFLTFVVERTLEGRQAEIKERTIGAEIFGRTAGFETSGDSIVRVNANEVRKRLAQYYRDLPERDPVQIVLPHGSYVPEFIFDDADARGARPDAVPVLTPQVSRWRRLWRYRWHAAGGALVSALGLVFLLMPRSTPLQRLWEPVLAGPSAPILTLPSTDTLQLRPEAMQQSDQFRTGEILNVSFTRVQTFHNWHTSLPVLQATLSVASALQRMGKMPLIRIGDDLRMDEVRGHPIVAIGSFSNSWARQNVAGLRFTFDRGASDNAAPSIRDARNPQRQWSLPHVYPDPQDKDYAIITRTFDPFTNEPFVSLAGLHSFGCQIAGEFVSQESFWTELAGRAPAGWEKMNLQVVLETKVIGTTTSTPKIDDAYFWK